ncbi:MAG: alpha/beta fold hydrolase [Sphingobium sp.]
MRVPHAVGMIFAAGAALAAGACAAPPVTASTVLASATPDTASIDHRYLTTADRHVSVDGVSYRVREEGPRDAPVILLIHGFSFSLESWDAWAADLSRDYRVIRFDLAGHGLSGTAPDGRYDADQRIERILVLMDRLGIRHATIAGNSYGGLLAWRIAAQHPQRVDHLILVDSAAFSINGVTDTPAPVPAGMLAYLLDPQPEMVRASAGLIFANVAALPQRRLEMMRDMIARPGNGAALVAHLEQFTLPPPEAQLARIAAPTLILWGSEDRVIPVEQSHRLNQAINGSRLEVFDGVGHAPQEEASDASLAAVRKFILQKQ